MRGSGLRREGIVRKTPAPGNYQFLKYELHTMINRLSLFDIKYSRNSYLKCANRIDFSAIVEWDLVWVKLRSVLLRLLVPWYDTRLQLIQNIFCRLVLASLFRCPMALTSNIANSASKMNPQKPLLWQTKTVPKDEARLMGATLHGEQVVSRLLV